jgi:hypothetical protein
MVLAFARGTEDPGSNPAMEHVFFWGGGKYSNAVVQNCALFVCLYGGIVHPKNIFCKNHIVRTAILD